jgi:predicted phosphodiesterase
MQAVFGNNDGDRPLLTRRGEGICSFKDSALETEVGGRRIALIHYPDLAEDLFESNRFNLAVCGHNHKPRVEGTERILLNPGTYSGYLEEKPTIAIVDADIMKVEIIGL